MTYLFSAVEILPVIVLAAAVLYAPVALLLHHFKKPYPWIRHIANYALIGYGLALVWVTFFWTATRAGTPVSDRLNLTPGDSFLYAFRYDGGLWSSQIMWNVCLFIPFGALLPCVFLPLRRRAWDTILFCFTISLLIEASQCLIGRVADLDDVICNTLGGIFGRTLYTVAAWSLRRVRFLGPLFNDNGKKIEHAAAVAAMSLTLVVPSVLDLLNAALPNGLFPVA